MTYGALLIQHPSFNLYLMNAPNPFKPASYEHTKSPAI